jgi:hypothetical protein
MLPTKQLNVPSEVSGKRRFQDDVPMARDFLGALQGRGFKPLIGKDHPERQSVVSIWSSPVCLPVHIHLVGRPDKRAEYRHSE